jgi:hypothetical protein
MHYPAADSELLQSYLDIAMLSIDRLSALANLLSAEDVASAFGRLSPVEQVAIFSSFEADLQTARQALLRTAEGNCVPHLEPHGGRS